MPVNAFLKSAKDLVETPERRCRDVKPEEVLNPPPPSKKLCTQLEKFVKKQEGDTTLLREPWIKV